MEPELNEQKFRNAVLYILQNAPTRPGLTVLLKMLYFADRQHYREHLTPITGAEYVAIQNGPVVNDYKILFANLVEEGILEERRVPVLGVGTPRIEYLPLYAPNIAVFSTTEIQVLDAIIEECGRSTGKALSERAHQEGPWGYVWNSQQQGQRIPYILFRWLDNQPDEDDLTKARQMLAQPDVAQELVSVRERAGV